MEDHDSQRIQQRYPAPVPFHSEPMGVPETPSSRSGSPAVVPTVPAKQPKRSNRAHLWQRVDPELLGERPPLDPDQLKR